jgi:uncharacterized protein
LARTQFDPAVLVYFVCPVSRGPLVYFDETSEVVSIEARLAYPVRDGIAILIPQECRVLNQEQDLGRAAKI